jgi:hypothetical protein
VPGRWTELVNTDSLLYGGSDIGNLGGVESENVPWMNQYHSAELNLPPLAALWLVPDDGYRRNQGAGARDPRGSRRARAATPTGRRSAAS